MISAKGEFRLDFGSEKEARAIYRALEPETHTGLSDRANARLHLMKNTVGLDIRATDAASFRACMDTYSRWVSMVKSLTEV